MGGNSQLPSWIRRNGNSLQSTWSAFHRELTVQRGNMNGHSCVGRDGRFSFDSALNSIICRRTVIRSESLTVTVWLGSFTFHRSKWICHMPKPASGERAHNADDVAQVRSLWSYNGMIHVASITLFSSFAHIDCALGILLPRAAASCLVTCYTHSPKPWRIGRVRLFADIRIGASHENSDHGGTGLPVCWAIERGHFRTRKRSCQKLSRHPNASCSLKRSASGREAC
jgi:hypothetical protein